MAMGKILGEGGSRNIEKKRKDILQRGKREIGTVREVRGVTVTFVLIISPQCK
jgi:hypothetical protein